MERRNFMKTAGGIGVGALAGGLGLTTLTGGATATSSADYGNVMLSSDDGTVEYVAIFGSSTVTWDGFESDAVEFRIVNEARIPGEVGWTQLNDTGKIDLSQSTWGGDDEDFSGVGTSGTIESAIGLQSNGNHDPSTDWHVVGSQSTKDKDGYGLPQNRIDPSSFETDSDGETETFTIELRSTYTWYSAGDSVEFEKPFTSSLDVEVENEARSASGSGDNSGAVAE